MLVLFPWHLLSVQSVQCISLPTLDLPSTVKAVWKGSQVCLEAYFWAILNPVKLTVRTVAGPLGTQFSQHLCFVLTLCLFPL